MTLHKIWHLLLQRLRALLARYRTYFLSLPERSTRSAAALIGGISFLLTDTLLPGTLRQTTFYRAFVGNIQRYIANRIGDVPLMDADLLSLNNGEIGNDFLQRKMVGNTLEVAGLLAMRVSPIWVFALATDAVEGGAVFAERLTQHLRRNGVIQEDTSPNDLTELLGAMAQALRTTAAPIDTPPLSRKDLALMSYDLRNSYLNLAKKSGQLLPEFEDVWQRMVHLTQAENISLEQLNGIMTLDVLQNNLTTLGKTGVDITQAVSNTSIELFDETILESYRHTLDQITAQGAAPYVSQTLRPFLLAAASHFDPKRSTWTEKWLASSNKPKILDVDPTITYL